MTYGAEIWGPPLIAAGASWLSNLGGDKETKNQRTKRKLVDDLLASLSGKGSYNDLFNTSEEAFNKSYVEPAKARFRNQIAPQIQQEYIAGGQQRGTGLDDQLLRAGVDMDQMLNEAYMGYQESGKNRKQNAINSVLGMGEGAQNNTSGWQAAGQGAGGYLASEGFAKAIANYGKNNQQTNVIPNRKGYTPNSMGGQANYNIFG